MEIDTKKQKWKPEKKNECTEETTANKEQSKFNKKFQIPFVDFVISNNSNAQRKM